jgi:hypothetical protein
MAEETNCVIQLWEINDEIKVSYLLYPTVCQVPPYSGKKKCSSEQCYLDERVNVDPATIGLIGNAVYAYVGRPVITSLF